MGFRTGSYAKVWEVLPVSDTRTKVRLSISRKVNDEYVQDFGDYVYFSGTGSARKAASLKNGDRIKLGDVDVRNRYDKEKRMTYYYPTVFSFEIVNDGNAHTTPPQKPYSGVDEGEYGEDESGDHLPF